MCSSSFSRLFVTRSNTSALLAATRALQPAERYIYIVSAGGATAAAAAPEVPLVAEAIARLEAQVVQHQAQLTQMVQLLVNDRLRPRSSSTSKQQRDRKCREDAIAYYYPQQGNAPTKLRCMLLDEELDAAQVVTAHIYQLHWGPEFARHLGIAMNDPRNLLLVVGAAEKRFDDLQWTLKPLVPSMGVGPEGRLRSQQTFKVLVLDPALLNPSSNQHTIAGHVSAATWSSVHRKQLVFAEGEGMPYRRACALHACRALQYAVEQGWAADHLSEEDMRVEEAAFAASPTCDAARFKQFLDSVAAASGVAEGSDGEGLSD